MQNACLIHDIGNPPFGHFGETIIKDYFSRMFENDESKFGLSKLEKEDFTNFDGNAQGFRSLTKLEVLNDAYGLNLTFATLGTFLKYPNADEINEKNLAQSKRGVFQSERGYLDRVANECGLSKVGYTKRHPLAFLMEAADSICYLVMDIEDGFNKKWYDYNSIGNHLQHLAGLNKVLEDLQNKYTDYGTEISKMVGLRIYLHF